MAGPASNDHDQDYHRGEMEISEQVSTFHLVMGMTKWGALVTAAGVVFFTMWFYPRGGFLPAFIAAAVLLVVGIVALRDKKTPGH